MQKLVLLCIEEANDVSKGPQFEINFIVDVYSIRYQKLDKSFIMYKIDFANLDVSLLKALLDIQR